MTVCSKGRADHVTRYGHPACKGHKTEARGGGCCRNNPVPGQLICKFHGAAAPQNKAAGEQREAERKTIDLARKLIPDHDDRDPITNPLQRLLELASEADAFRESLRELANKIEGEIRYGTTGSGEQLRAEVTLYRSALRDTVDVLVAIAKLDIEKTLARVEQQKVDMVQAAMNAGLDEAEVPDDVKRKVMVGVSRHLRLVAG